MRCRECGQESPEGFRFCGSCGAALASEAAPAREERKIVTVLFADLVGFTARAETMDPEDVRALLVPYHARLRDELERFGGTVEKFIGDAVMALFGAPVAHEDDPERAVRAALAIRDWVREEEQLHVRIAVNTGEALVSLGARPGAGEAMASGDVVNTTARMQSSAPVNGIFVGETTFRATRDLIEYREHEPVVAKGKAEPIRVWLADQSRSRLGVDVVQESRAPLVGRDHELGVLQKAFARAQREPSVQLVTLVGVPGIGKSRLVYELMPIVSQHSELVTWRQGRCLPYGEGVTFWALGEMIKAEAGVLETDAPNVVAEKLNASVDALVDETDAGWVKRHLGVLVGASDESDGTGSRDEAFAAWRRYLEALAEHHPAVLVFEDLHWADDALLDFIEHVADWAGEVPLLVVATARPELLDRRPGWGGGLRNATTLSLRALDDVETAKMIGALLDRPVLPAEAQTSLLERAEGNPLYAEQYVRMYTEHASAHELPLPETVQGIIAARLDGLPREEKDLLQSAAVVGKVFWTGALDAVGGAARAHAEQLLHALDRKEFVRRERRPSLAGEGEYSFRHVLVRDVAYSQIPRPARAEKHLRAAKWIESLGRPRDHAEMLAYHYSTALELERALGRDGTALVRRTRAALRAAGQRAASVMAFAAALAYFQQALALEPEGRERLDLVFEHAVAAFSGYAEDRAEVLEPASTQLLEAGDFERAAELAAMLAEVWWLRADNAAMTMHVDRAIALVRRGPPSNAKAQVLSQAARYRGLSRDFESSLVFGKEALELAEEFGLDELKAQILITLGTTRTMLGDTKGIDQIWQGLAAAQAANAINAIGRAYQNLMGCTWQWDFPKAAEYGEEARRSYERLGPRASAYSEGSSIANLYWLGRWDESLSRADDFISHLDTSEYAEGGVREVRALMRIARGDEAGALEDIERALAIGEGAHDPQAFIPSRIHAAMIALIRGRRDEADHYANQVLAESTHAFLHHQTVEFGLVMHELGRADEVRPIVDGHPVRTPWHEAARGVVAGDFAAAADIVTEMGMLTTAAQVRLAAAPRLAADRHRAEADKQLREALAFYRSVGAIRYVRHCEALLAAIA